jgi:hypothetical protein
LTSDLPADDVEHVAAVIAQRCTSRTWINIRDQTGLSTDQGRRAMVRPPQILLGALGPLGGLGVEGSEIPEYLPEGSPP